MDPICHTNNFGKQSNRTNPNTILLLMIWQYKNVGKVVIQTSFFTNDLAMPTI
jgi:hypothetical protein